MSELEEIKTRVDEVREALPFMTGAAPSTLNWIRSYVTTCDSLIAIAEGVQGAFNLMMDERVKVSSSELEQARADVLKLRDAIKDWESMSDRIATAAVQGLADTEHYEKYRAQEPVEGGVRSNDDSGD